MTHKSVMYDGHPRTKSGFLKNQSKTTVIKRPPTIHSFQVIGPSSLYFLSITAAATFSPCSPMSIARASLLSGLNNPMYIICSHNQVKKPIISIGGTVYNVQEAKFIPGLSGNRLFEILKIYSLSSSSKLGKLWDFFLQKQKTQRNNHNFKNN